MQQCLLYAQGIAYQANGWLMLCMSFVGSLLQIFHSRHALAQVVPVRTR
jgi:hypothetical protein